MAIHDSWFDTPTILHDVSPRVRKSSSTVSFSHFCNQVQSWPAPIKLAPKQSMLMTDVASTAIQGTWFLFRPEKSFGACLSMARV